MGHHSENIKGMIVFPVNLSLSFMKNKLFISDCCETFMQTALSLEKM